MENPVRRECGAGDVCLPRRSFPSRCTSRSGAKWARRLAGRRSPAFPALGIPGLALPALGFLFSLQLLSPGALFGEPVGNRARDLDPVVIAGSGAELTGFPLDHYGLYARRGDGWDPVPFQIDEVDPKGRVLLGNGEPGGKDSEPGVFDANDELVFLARDAGERCPGDALLPGGASARSEIALSDPLKGAKSWVYLLAFDTPPERSSVDYVRYEPGRKQVVTTRFTAGFDPRFPVSTAAYAFAPGIGGDGEDILDRVKVRLNFKVLISLDATEEDIRVKEIGYTDGPVRVILRSRNKLELVVGIPGSSTVGDTLFYESFVDFPFLVDFPVRPSRFRVLVYDDFRDCTGWSFFNSNNPAAHPVDGRMDDGDRRLDPSPWTWSALSNGKVTFWSLAVVPPSCPVKPHLYFNDDRGSLRPPEDVPGELPGAGWDFREGWEQVKEYPVEFRLLHFFTQGYRPGDEAAVLAVLQHPLRVEAKRLP